MSMSQSVVHLWCRDPAPDGNMCPRFVVSAVRVSWRSLGNGKPFLHVSGSRILCFRSGKVSRVRLAWNELLVATRVLPAGVSDRARRCGSARVEW
eukprot:6270566-Alexandrium_andersonii.AAC.1